MWANFQRIIELFTQKIVTKLSNMGLGSGKNLFRIPDPGVKKAPDPDPQHWKEGSGSVSVQIIMDPDLKAQKHTDP
jgi:hypothetical protein